VQPCHGSNPAVSDELQSFRPLLPAVVLATKGALVKPVVLGLLSGVAFGVADVLLMLPLQFADRTTALLAAFASRFAIGFLIPQCRLPLPLPAAGALVGLLISLPDAIITKAYAPVLISGVIGGAVIGWVSRRFAG
jgi:hypothetical protein